MRELALHLLDIAENSVSASAQNITIEVVENTFTDSLSMTVIDDGRGMDDEMVQRITDPFTTSRTTRKVGLGIPLLKAAAEACEGSLEINSVLGKGTTLTVNFKRSHIDRMPLGDIASTILTLVIGSPEIHWVFRYRVNDREFVFDDEPIKKDLEGLPLSDPAVLGFLREYVNENIENIRLIN